ncbi:MAG: hypothetical protein AB7O43_01875 [Hyphomicrobiaceae bacterium]
MSMLQKPDEQPDEDVTPSPSEVDMMASVLEGRHGIHAAHVADFLTEANAQRGDASRSWAWAAVAERIRRRTDERLCA